MKPLKPYIALFDVENSNVFELEVLIQSQAGYKLNNVTVSTETDQGKTNDVVLFTFVEDVSATPILHEYNFVMTRAQGQEMVTVKAVINGDDGGPKPGGGSSSGHYGDPTN
jgi:hypothetical protein